MVRAAIDRDLPLLAICRGMQILNVAFGGTLEQNLVAADGSSPHRKVVGTFDGNDHTVRLVPGSVAARAVGEELHVAHCHHHQALRDLGACLVVSGRAEDGVVEAVEVTDGRWALGVQWHPEANDRSRLFSALLEASVQRAARGRPLANPGVAPGSSQSSS